MITHRIDDNGSAYSIARQGNGYQLISTHCPSISITPDERRKLVDGDLLPHDIINRP